MCYGAEMGWAAVRCWEVRAMTRSRGELEAMSATTMRRLSGSAPTVRSLAAFCAVCTGRRHWTKLTSAGRCRPQPGPHALIRCARLRNAWLALKQGSPKPSQPTHRSWQTALIGLLADTKQPTETLYRDAFALSTRLCLSSFSRLCRSAEVCSTPVDKPRPALRSPARQCLSLVAASFPLLSAWPRPVGKAVLASLTAADSVQRVFAIASLSRLVT